MAFSAKIKDIEKKENGAVRIVAVVTDGTIKKMVEYTISHKYQDLNWLKDQLRNEVDNLANIDAGILNLETGPIDLTVA